MKQTLIVALILGVTRMAVGATEAPEYELICRSKAKEIAAETYRGCVVDARTTQIDQLRKDYQDRLRSMKQDYERQLKQLGSGKSAKASETSNALPKKSANKVATVTTGKMSPKKVMKASDAVEEMNVELKPTARVNSDDSSLDIPEPTPVENVPTSEEGSPI